MGAVGPGTDFLQLHAGAAPPGGLTAWLVDAVRSAVVDGRLAPGAPLPADRDGAFVDGAGAGFAAVRSGDVWFAVNGRPLQPDLRYDTGLVALKRREEDGSWRDLIRPRPMTVGRPPAIGTDQNSVTLPPSTTLIVCQTIRPAPAV